VLNLERHTNYTSYGIEVLEIAQPIYEWSRSDSTDSLTSILWRFEDDVVQRNVAPYRYWVLRISRKVLPDSVRPRLLRWEEEDS
jgi:hypothetical protein